MFRIKFLLWAYRQVLAVTVLSCYGAAVLALLFLLAYAPGAVLYLLDVVSPITEAIKSALWGLFPGDAPKWIKAAGGWLGAATRWTLSFTKAREEAIGRILLLDGFVLVSLMAWVFVRISGLWVNVLVARWFNRRYCLVRRQSVESLMPQERDNPPTSAPAEQPKKLPQAPQLQKPPH